MTTSASAPSKATVPLATAAPTGVPTPPTIPPMAPLQAPPLVQSDLKFMVDRLDEMLGSDRVDDHRDESTLRLGVSDSFRRLKEEEHYPKLHVGFNLKLGILDSWKDQLTLWFRKRIDRYEKKIYRAEESIAALTKKTANEKAAAKDPNAWTFSLEKNFEMKKEPSFSLFVRMRKDFEFYKVYNSFAVEPGWDFRTHWQASVNLVSSISLSSKSILQLNQLSQWSVNTENLLTTESLNYSHFFSPFRVFTCALSASMKTQDNHSALEEYRLAPGFRLALYRDWSYLSMNPFLSFTREQKFHGDPGVFISLDSVF